MSPSEQVSLERPALVARRTARVQALTVVLISSVVSMVGLFGMLLPEDERTGLYLVLGVLSLSGGVLVALTDRRIGLSLSQLVRSGTELRQSAAERAAELARLNAELRRRDRERADLFATMSHELRTPLNAIIGHSRVLLDGLDGELTAEQTADVRQIHGGGLGLLRVVNETLDFARLEASAPRLARETVHVWALVEEVIALLRPLAEAKGLDLSSAIGPGLPPVVADEERLRQVLVNLAGNALKFTSRGYVRLDASLSGESVIIRVEDSGIGIPAGEHARVFEPFRQADPERSGHHGGTGLGLTIARRLVELMGGRIWLESEPGRGSTFLVALGRAREGTSSSGDGASDTAVSETAAIVLLTDVRRGQVLAASLAQRHLTVRTVCGPDWQGQTRSLAPRLVLADVSMAGAGAWRALAALCSEQLGEGVRLGLIGSAGEGERVVGTAIVLAGLHALPDESLNSRLPSLLPAAGFHGMDRAVLIVGPDGDWRRRVALTVQAARYGVHESVTGDAAVSVARRVQPAAVVVDLRVGSPGVIEVLAELQAAVGRRACPLIVAIPAGLTPSEMRDLRLGALSWITADACPLPLLSQELAGQISAQGPLSSATAQAVVRR